MGWRTQPNDFQAVALITREVICEVIYRNRADWHPDHPNKALRIRDIPLDRILRVAFHLPVEKPVAEMSKDELKAYAAWLLDEVLKGAAQQ